jgi:hypothetical protein
MDKGNTGQNKAVKRTGRRREERKQEKHENQEVRIDTECLEDTAKMTTNKKDSKGVQLRRNMPAKNEKVETKGENEHPYLNTSIMPHCATLLQTLTFTTHQLLFHETRKKNRRTRGGWGKDIVISALE